MVDETILTDIDDTEAAAGSSNGARTPPYIAFQTFLTFLKELKDNGLPPQIDKSVLRRFSGGVQNQLKMAIRSLGLVDGAKPTPDLAALVGAYETPEFTALLAKMLHATYPYVFALDLMTATPQMFADSFKVTGAKEDVLRKCRTFFLHAAKQAGVQLGQRLLTGSVPRSPRQSANGGTARRRSASRSNQHGDGNNNPPPPPPPSNPAIPGDLRGQLVGKFPTFDPAWDNSIKAAWFDGFKQLVDVVEKPTRSRSKSPTGADHGEGQSKE